MSDLKVEVCLINKVENHPNADKLDIVSINLWNAVVQKGGFKENDLCVYFPLDSILPQELESKIFGINSKVKLEKSRVRSIKLRGAVSMGLVCKFETLGITPRPLGTDLTEELGVTKYEPPVKLSPQSNAKQVSKKQVHPEFRKYTDISNFRNTPHVFEVDETVSVTEKVHGSNFRCGYLTSTTNTWYKKILKFFRLLPQWQFVLGSHNVQLQDKLNYKGYYETNVYAEAAKAYNLREILKPGEVVYGEVFGFGLQGQYTYGCKEGERKLVLFDLMKDSRYVDVDDFFAFCKERNLPHVPEVYRGPYDPDVLRNLTFGASVLAPSQEVREGIVIKPLKERTGYAGRAVLKFVSDDYLMNKNNTEWH